MQISYIKQLRTQYAYFVEHSVGHYINHQSSFLFICLKKCKLLVMVAVQQLHKFVF